MRLIDANQTKREITKYLEECIDNNKIEIDVTELQIRVFGIINNQPTAYDPEKVVAEFEKLSNAEADYYYAKSNDVIDRETAIEIVRKGGVE